MGRRKNWSRAALRRRAEEQMTHVQAEQIRSARRAFANKSLWQGDS
jgi:hypothetical protein